MADLEGDTPNNGGGPTPQPEDDSAAQAAGRRGRGGLRGALASRGMRWGAATAVYVGVVAAALVGVNLVGAHIPTQWDLTFSHNLTLSAPSRNIAAKVTHPVHIIAFERPGGTTGAKVSALLQQYAQASHGKITYQVVDPAANAALAVRYQIKSYNTIVLQSGSHTQTISGSSLSTYTSSGQPKFNGEQPITNALLQLASPTQMTVDFLAGNGEPSTTGSQMPDAVRALQGQGYKVGSLNLLTSHGVPSTVSAVLIVDPTQDLPTSSVLALKKYAAGGGHLVFLLDPSPKHLKNLSSLLSGWGVTPQNDLVVDPSHSSQSPVFIVPKYGSSPITAPLQQSNYLTLLLGAQGLTLGKAPKGYTVTPVLTTYSGGTSTHPASYGITNLSKLNTTGVGFTKGQDIAGPLTVAATIAGPSGSKQFRAVVIGNAGFVASAAPGQTQAPINIQGNRDLFLNSVGWATGRSQGITIRPRPSLNTQVFLTSSSTSALVDTFVLGVPLVCFLLAAGAWWTRRRL